jgi:octaprenyl-diphosphate synthase
LPVIHSLLKTNDAEMMKLANKVKNHSVTPAEIAQLVQFTKDNGGIEYAEKRMKDFQIEAEKYVHSCEDPDIRASLQAYLDFVIDRNN